jgi:hypothetical protein
VIRNLPPENFKKRKSPTSCTILQEVPDLDACSELMRVFEEFQQDPEEDRCPGETRLAPRCPPLNAGSTLKPNRKSNSPRSNRSALSKHRIEVGNSPAAPAEIVSENRFSLSSYRGTSEYIDLLPDVSCYAWQAVSFGQVNQIALNKINLIDTHFQSHG